ncbi:MAG: glutaredoxin family protein [Candidatus Woesearchaeota archaeon]|nr:MAG: glutaredoxin family protein [Candidatus Woesearchaeota archaeon]
MKIVIYSTPTCHHCHYAKRFLEENNIDFKEIDVSMDPEAAAEMVMKSGQQGVPVIDIDGNIVVGFNREKIIELLGL